MASGVEHGVTAQVGTDPMIPELYRVRRVHRETADTFALNLEAAGRTRAFRFRPGQFNMLYVFGVGEVPISISGDSQRILTHTTRVVGTVTKAMSRLRRGDIIGVRGPFGSSWPIEEAAAGDAVVVAGGIGLAPLRGALIHLARRRNRGRLVLLYGVRTAEDILFRRELERLRERGLDLYVTVDRSTGDWRGNVGVVTALIPRAPFDPLNCVAMVCGPEIMMWYSVRELVKRGVPESKIFLSLERNMKCAVGFCGHCQFGPEFICKDGPVFRYDHIKKWLSIAQL